MSCTGTVKFFSATKGYGFIIAQDGSEVFVHATQVQGNPLKEGDEVQYDSGDNNGRACALNVTGGTGQHYQKGFNNKGFGKGGFGGNKGFGKGGFGKGFNQGGPMGYPQQQWGGAPQQQWGGHEQFAAAPQW